MERRSERLALLQKLKPISYRETGVKRVFKKIRRKRHSASMGHKSWKDNGPETVWSGSDSEDSGQPCCSKYLVDQTHLLTQQCFEAPPLVEPRTNIMICPDPQPLVLVEKPLRRMVKILAFPAFIFLLGLFYVFLPGLYTPSGTSKWEKRRQQRHQNEILQQNLQRQIGLFRQRVFGLRNFADVLGSVHDHWEIQKHIYLQAHGSKNKSNYIPKEDFALKSAGATVVKYSKSYNAGAQLCMLGFCWDYLRSPEVILERDNAPGNCWAMDGSEGYIIIKLSRVVCPISVALDHISKTVSHNEDVSSAPQNFSIYISIKNIP
nr:SUN domain-containing protein 3-like [Pogona vitticeps]